MIVNRVFARASHYTFTIPPIAELISRYVDTNGINWADPFAGMNSPAQYTNDIRVSMKATHHMEADKFCRKLVKDKIALVGVLFDPPYSYRQITEHYTEIGLKASSMDTSYNFYHRVMKAINPAVLKNGITISCGWNSNGFPKAWGYEIEEVLIVAHGLHHNDTIVTVQRKVK